MTAFHCANITFDYQDVGAGAFCHSVGGAGGSDAAAGAGHAVSRLDHDAAGSDLFSGGRADATASPLAIERAYRQYGSPLQRLAGLSPAPRCRHVYSLDRHEDYLHRQQDFAAEHRFFSVVRLEQARTHLGILERPEAVLGAVDDFFAYGT
ncbi:hypothetical protein [Serratia ficaria]|uniref:hypothetical protein n=1 Tax=Serratia ficaria TaxID=61651 RepID=UPI001E29042A|nr:hypothetical protein [Serratia ficaria]